MLESIIGLFKRRDDGALGGEEDPGEVQGPLYGELPLKGAQLPRDYIGEEPDDLAAENTEAEAKLWQHERQLYDEKDQSP